MSKKDEAILKDIVDGIQAASKQQTTPYDTTAEVTRVDGNTAYVHIPGGVDETPVTLTQNAKPGDNVQVRVSGGRAWIVGNATAPPTDDTTANIANTKATKAETKAVVAEVRAAEASDKAASANTKAEEAIEAVAPAIVTDTLHYLATDLGSGVTINTPGWTLTPQSMTSVNKYLWTYHTYHKASGQSTNTQPAITGVYGDSGSTGPQGPEGPRGATGADGDDGVSVASVQPQYYLSTSDQNPTGGNWSTTLMYETGKFIWTRDLITYSTGSTSYSQEICNYALSDTCLNAEDALMLAEGIDEHFWYDNTGAHVTEDKQADYQQDPSSAGGNTLITHDGMAVREGTTELASFSGTNGAVIGKTSEKNMVVNSNGILGRDGSEVVANLGFTGNGDYFANTSLSNRLDYQQVGCTQEISLLEDAAPGDPYTRSVKITSRRSNSFNDFTSLEVYCNDDTGGNPDDGIRFIINGTVIEVSDLAEKTEIPTNTSDLTNDSGFISRTGLFKVVSKAESHTGSLAAHTNWNIGDSVSLSSIAPSGMTFVGIVGFSSSNMRISPYKMNKSGNLTVSLGVTNTTASAISSNFTVTFFYLFINGTSA